MILIKLGTVVSNPNVDHASALTAAFTKYQPEKTVVYPAADAVQKVADQFKSATEDGFSRLSLTGAGDPAASPAVRGEALAYAEQLRFLAERDPMHEIHEQEKKFLWSLRYEIAQQVP